MGMHSFRHTLYASLFMCLCIVHLHFTHGSLGHARSKYSSSHRMAPHYPLHKRFLLCEVIHSPLFFKFYSGNPKALLASGMSGPETAAWANPKLDWMYARARGATRELARPHSCMTNVSFLFGCLPGVVGRAEQCAPLPCSWHLFFYGPIPWVTLLPWKSILESSKVRESFCQRYERPELNLKHSFSNYRAEMGAREQNCWCSKRFLHLSSSLSFVRVASSCV